MAITNKYEQLDALLDGAVLMDSGWANRLQDIRHWTDDAYDKGSLAKYQWRALVTRSAKIQDLKNDQA